MEREKSMGYDFEKKWLQRALPWNADKFDVSKRPLFIGCTGGTASGKTSVCDM